MRARDRARLRRAVAFVSALTTTSLLLVGDARPGATEEPTALAAPYSCDGIAEDADGVEDSVADLDAFLSSTLGGSQSVADFTDKWSARLTGDELIAGLTLDAFLVRPDSSLAGLPQTIHDEGYHTLELAVQHCLVGKLYDALVTAGEPGFPHPSLTPLTAKALLHAFVFDNQWILDLKGTASPPTVPEVPPLPVDAMDALLDSLRSVAAPGLPSVAVPPELNPVPLVLKTVDELQAGLLNPVNQLFANLGNLIGQLQLPITLPEIKLPAVDVAGLINLVRGVVDSSMYRVCWTGPKTIGAVRCGPLAQPEGADVPVPLGTPVLVDLAGDARPDATAQLVPQLTSGLGIGYQWKLTRLSSLASGVSASTPIPAHVFAIFSVPTGDLQLSVGTDGTPSTIPATSDYTFTLEDPEQVAEGEIKLAVRLAHAGRVGAKSGMSFGVSPLTRDAGELGTSSSTTFDTGTLHFSPVPLSSANLLGGYSKTIDAGIQLETADFERDGHMDNRVEVELTMPQPNVVLDARVLSKLPPAAGAECCPFREITTTVNAMPTDTKVRVDSFPSKRITDATYDANAPIGQVDFAAKMFPKGQGEYPTGADANTFSKVTAKVQLIPTHVHVNHTAPDPATPAKTHVVHYDANATIPHAEFTSEQWAHDPAANASAKQRRLFFGADTIPSVIDLTATTTEVTSRNSTGHITYQANGNVTNVQVDNEDVIGVSHLKATVASLPRAIDVNYDTESPADLNPLKFGFEDPGHTIVHVDGRNQLADAPGSATFGTMSVKFRSKVSDFLAPDSTIAAEEHAIVNMDPRAANTPLDDTIQVDLRYTGLRLLDAEVLENGRVAATIRNEAEKTFIAQVNKPDLRLSVVIDKLPKQVSFVKEDVGSKDRNKITYAGCTPSGTTCTPKKIDSVKVRIDGVIPASSLPPPPAKPCPPSTDPNAPIRPALTQGEFVDATISDVPASVTVDLDLPQCARKTIVFDASTSTGRITAAIRKAAGDLGTVNVAAEVTSIPTHVDASFGEGGPITFTSGTGQAVGEVKAVVTNTGQAAVPATFSPHANAKYIESPNALPALEASLGLKNLESFSFDSGEDGNFTGAITTKDVSPTPNPNSPFTITADVRTLATDDAGNKINDQNKATVIKTGPGGAVLKPLPTRIVISKEGGLQPGGADTSTLTIDTTGSVAKPEFFADIAIGGPDGVIDALAESLPAVQGVHVGDGAATNESDAIRLVLYLPATPSKSIVRYGQITLDKAMPASPTPSFDISGFGTLPSNRMDIALDLDDKPIADRLHATVGLGGVIPALGFLKFFPLAIVDNPAPTDPAFDSFLDIEVRAQSGASAGALDLDLRLGEHSTQGANRPDTRVIVHTDTVPAATTFGMRLGQAAAPDLAAFRTEFRAVDGSLTGSPGHATVRFQQPAEDGKNLDQNPPSKVTLDLKDVPSKIDFVVKEAASVKSGNPNETCGLKESDFVLPTLVYTSSGANQNSVDLTAEIDTALFEDDPAKKATAATVKMELTDLANGFTIKNTDAGDRFEIDSPNAATGGVIVKIDPFDITLLDLDWTGCESSDDLISWEADGRARVRISPENLRLAMTGVRDVELFPGFSTGVTGDFGTVSLALPNPQFEVVFSDGFFGGIKIHLSDDIEGTIPVLTAPNGTIGFPLPVVFHVAEQTSGEWFDFNTFIPCPFPPFFVYAVANIKPHRVALSTNSFTVTGGTWTITADPFGASAGLSYLLGIDIIDTIAGLFTSPYDHGLQAPSLECESAL